MTDRMHVIVSPTDYTVEHGSEVLVVAANSFDDAAEQFRKHGYVVDMHKIMCVNTERHGGRVLYGDANRTVEARRLTRL